MIGVFPQIGMKAIQNLIALPLRPLIPSLVRDYPLSDLDGLNIWYESRLLEVGIEDMQNLATANLVDAILKTRVPVDRLVDWVDQAHLFLRVRDVEDGPQDRSALRRLGIRTATDLEDAFEPGYAPGVFGSAPTTEGQSEEFLELLRRVLNTEGDGLPEHHGVGPADVQPGAEPVPRAPVEELRVGSGARRTPRTPGARPRGRGGAGSIEGAELRLRASGGRWRGRR